MTYWRVSPGEAIDGATVREPKRETGCDQAVGHFWVQLSGQEMDPTRFQQFVQLFIPKNPETIHLRPQHPQVSGQTSGGNFGPEATTPKSTALPKSGGPPKGPNGTPAAKITLAKVGPGPVGCEW